MGGFLRVGLQALAGALLLSAIPEAAVAGPAQDSGPVSHWKLDEGTGTQTVDATGGGGDGVLIGGVAWSADVPPTGFPNPGSLLFDGSDDYVNVDLAPFGGISDNFTMSLWAKPLEPRPWTPESNTGMTGTSNQRFAVFPTNGYGAYGGLGEAGAGISVGTNGISVFEHKTNHTPSVLVHDVAILDWVHVAVVYQGRTPTLYLDGRHVKHGMTSLMQVHPSPRLGGKNPQWGWFKGWIDDYRIYDRILANSEIASLAAGAESFLPTTAVLTVAGSTHRSILVAWYAPEGDSGNPASGPAASYDLRYSSAGPIETSDEFDRAMAFGVPFAPGPPRALQTVEVTNLAPLTTYHFCLRSVDGGGHWSRLSNTPAGATGPDTPPAQAFLEVVRTTPDSVTLGWTAPGEDGSAGTAAAYDARMQTSGPIETEEGFLAAVPVPGLPAPAAAGTYQTAEVRGLKQRTTYHFALRTRDSVGHVSPISNNAVAVTTLGGSSGRGASCLVSVRGGPAVGLVMAVLSLWGVAGVRFVRGRLRRE